MSHEAVVQTIRTLDALFNDAITLNDIDSWTLYLDARDEFEYKNLGFSTHIDPDVPNGIGITFNEALKADPADYSTATVRRWRKSLYSSRANRTTLIKRYIYLTKFLNAEDLGEADE